MSTTTSGGHGGVGGGAGAGEAGPGGARGKVFTHEARLDASVTDVWNVLTDAAELRRWFPIDARVRPGVGGSVFLSWGPACEGEAPITLWEPERRYGWMESHEGGAVQISVQFEIRPDPERGGAGTILKVVHSGFGKGAKWDDMYDSIANGWKFEFRSLAHYLKRHRGGGAGGVLVSGAVRDGDSGGVAEGVCRGAGGRADGGDAGGLDGGGFL